VIAKIALVFALLVAMPVAAFYLLWVKAHQPRRRVGPSEELGYRGFKAGRRS